MIGFSLKKTVVFTFLICIFGFQSCFLQKNIKQEETAKEKAVLENEEAVFDFSELNKKLLKTEEAKTEEGMRYIDLITDFDGKKIRIGISEVDTSWNVLSTPEFGNDAYYLGILNVNWKTWPHSNLQLLSLNVPITKAGMMEAHSPNDVKILT